jgi:F-type H+/Na+-transporting ATPase subunit beta
MYRFTQAGHELATVMNTIPSEDGYQATLTSEMGDLNERLISTIESAVTSIYAVFVPADDFTDYGTRSAFSYLDTTIMLSREIFQSGRYPAVDVLTSTSSAVSPNYIGNEHYLAYIQAKQVLEAATELERIVSLVGLEELSPDNQKIYRRSQLIMNYITQDLFLDVSEGGIGSFYEPRENTIKVMQMIINGEYDHTDPEKFRYAAKAPEPEKKPVEKQAPATEPIQ